MLIRAAIWHADFVSEEGQRAADREPPIRKFLPIILSLGRPIKRLLARAVVEELAAGVS